MKWSVYPLQRGSLFPSGTVRPVQRVEALPQGRLVHRRVQHLGGQGIAAGVFPLVHLRPPEAAAVVHRGIDAMCWRQLAILWGGAIGRRPLPQGEGWGLLRVPSHSRGQRGLGHVAGAQEAGGTRFRRGHCGGIVITWNDEDNSALLQYLSTTPTNHMLKAGEIPANHTFFTVNST